jgi:NAD(P)-dependent dehydrogenase (short-subunit alcohol dehydrogenase family)
MFSHGLTDRQVAIMRAPGRGLALHPFRFSYLSPSTTICNVIEAVVGNLQSWLTKRGAKHRIIAVNQTSVFLGTGLAAEQMAKTGGGSIVNISSIIGFVGSTGGHPAYHASKGAVRIYSKATAVRYGPLGVRVNTVHPGYMLPMLNATNAGERDDKIALTPLRRIGKPIEVAYGVLFLASDEASFVTGAELVIDGGFIGQ